MMNMLNRTWIIKLVLVSFICLNAQQVVFAGMVGTTELVNDEIVLSEKQKVLDMLAREDVQAKLESLGVNPQDARLRVENMTHEELKQLSAQMDELPAGSGAVGAIVFVFLVLLITDLLGYTDIFPFVKKTAR